MDFSWVSKTLKLTQTQRGDLWCRLYRVIAFVTVMALFLGGVEVKKGKFVEVQFVTSPQPATAQTFVPQDAWREVYRRLPNLPLENQYVNLETGQVDPDNTLVGRFIRYHAYLKGRPLNYRLDWKLTIADYLGANELIQESTYPGKNNLKVNPIEADIAAINQLSRSQRNAFVEVLVSIFTPNSQTTPVPSTSPKPTTTPRPTADPRLPRPGDAQLLKSEELKR